MIGCFFNYILKFIIKFLHLFFIIFLLFLINFVFLINFLICFKKLLCTKSLPNYNEGGTPVQILLGTRDHIFNMDNALVVANHLSSHGHKVKFVKIPQHTHWYYAVGELINQKALSFFGTQDCRNR